jgi:hypothetical protein
MTAIGFVFYVVGFVFVRWFGVSAIESLLGESNKFDIVGVPLIYIGFMLMVSGLAVRLWEIMP